MVTLKLTTTPASIRLSIAPSAVLLQPVPDRRSRLCGDAVAPVIGERLELTHDRRVLSDDQPLPEPPRVGVLTRLLDAVTGHGVPTLPGTGPVTLCGRIAGPREPETASDLRHPQNSKTRLRVDGTFAYSQKGSDVKIRAPYPSCPSTSTKIGAT
jgi:hypothetical protein